MTGPRYLVYTFQRADCQGTGAGVLNTVLQQRQPRTSACDGYKLPRPPQDIVGVISLLLPNRGAMLSDRNVVQVNAPRVNPDSSESENDRQTDVFAPVGIFDR